MTRLVLIRHGETDWNLEGRWQGQADVPLNLNGYAQAKEVAEQLANIPLEAIYSSDLQRTRDTARAIGEQKGLAVKIDPRLREISHGLWEGMQIKEIESQYQQEFQARRKDPYHIPAPGGENGQQVQERMLAALQDIIICHPNGSVAVVSHGYALAVVRAYFTNYPFNQVRELVPKNSEIIQFEVRDGFNLINNPQVQSPDHLRSDLPTGAPSAVHRNKRLPTG